MLGTRPEPAGRDQLCRLCRVRRGSPCRDRRRGPRADAPASSRGCGRWSRASMCQGALGLSTGLFYAPQSFAQNRGGDRAGPGSGRAGRQSTTAICATNPPIRSASPRRWTRRSPSAARGSCRSTSPTSRRSASTSRARRRRSSPRSRRRARPASRSPPINIPGRPRARASPPRWCRAGRMTAGGPRCCGVSTIRRAAARLHARHGGESAPARRRANSC